EAVALMCQSQLRLRVERPDTGMRAPAWQLRTPSARAVDLLARVDAALVQASGPLGIQAANDAMALDLYRALDRRLSRRGKALGLIGFDDQDAARTEGLSSMTPPLAALGDTAARLLLDGLGGRPLPSLTRLPSMLAARASTAAVAGNG
ncbi:MAG: substrate-binding domain-containing protein, partial [Planctomycetes bacterium]|nr:substrate-binding domain-containing protein [Planctomycetota bacterium]